MRVLAAVGGLTTWLLAAGVVSTVPPSAVSGLAALAPSAVEGFGATTPGGRGGRELAVTTLADSGPGSFRAAVTASGRRTVVFRVAGLVTLETPVTIGEPFLTIDGASAPGDGLCLRGSEVVVRTHDVIIRHVRFRPGDIGGKEVDALDVGGDSHHVVIDHVSASWAVDEVLSASGAIHDVTIQWSIIAEGLNRSVHSKGPHGYGSLVRAVGGITLHHNLWAHNESRNPRLGDNYGREPWPTFDVRNNVIYDYGSIASGMTGDRISTNYVGNYIRPGPSTRLGASSRAGREPIVLTDTAAVTYFVEGNIVEGRADLTADNTQLFTPSVVNGRSLVTIVRRPFDAPPVRTTSAAQALTDVLAGAGATLPRRDAVDARIVREVETRTGRIIDSQKDVGGWPDDR
jgi:pectate lyase